MTVPAAPAVTLVYSAERNGDYQAHSAKQCANLPIFSPIVVPACLNRGPRPRQKYLLPTYRQSSSFLLALSFLSAQSRPLSPAPPLLFSSALCPLRLRFLSRRLSRAASFAVVPPSICQARPSQGVSGEKAKSLSALITHPPPADPRLLPRFASPRSLSPTPCTREFLAQPSSTTPLLFRLRRSTALNVLSLVWSTLQVRILFTFVRGRNTARAPFATPPTNP